MDKDSLLYRTREIVRTDRLELMRENADKQKTYCFFASLYEVAYHIHKDKMPPRYKQAEAEWLSFGIDDQPGGIKIEEILNLLTKLANIFGITIEKIYTDRLFLSHFLQDKVKDATVVDTGKKKTIYRAHAESYTSLPKSDRRIDTVLADDWLPVVAVTFSNEPNPNADNTIESIPIEHAGGQVIYLQAPYLLVMVKQET